MKEKESNSESAAFETDVVTWPTAEKFTDVTNPHASILEHPPSRIRVRFIYSEMAIPCSYLLSPSLLVSRFSLFLHPTRNAVIPDYITSFVFLTALPNSKGHVNRDPLPLLSSFPALSSFCFTETLLPPLLVLFPSHTHVLPTFGTR